MPRASLARMSRVSPSRRRIRSALAIGVTLCAALVALPGAATASPLDPDRERELAQAQFQVYLLTATDLRPASITCTTPSGIGAPGDLVCYAIVDGTTTISALATPVGNFAFEFAAITKAGRPAATLDAGASPVVSGVGVDEYMAGFEGDGEVLGSMFSDEDITVSVQRIEWQPQVSTLFVEITTTTAGGDAAGSDGDRLAWELTDMLASGWEVGTPLRAPDATVRPRLEVVVDGVVYGTPYEVMVDVADYAIDEAAWLEITTQAGPVGTKRPAFDGAVASLPTASVFHTSQIVRRAGTSALIGAGAGVIQA